MHPDDDDDAQSKSLSTTSYPIILNCSMVIASTPAELWRKEATVVTQRSDEMVHVSYAISDE